MNQTKKNVDVSDLEDRSMSLSEAGREIFEEFCSHVEGFRWVDLRER